MKKNATRHALLTSVISLLLCVSMLVGTTFAWFTDSVTSGRNTIMAGNLDVELEYSTDLVNWTAVDANTNIFDDEALWEPGYTEVVYLRVSNVGTLAMKYKLGIDVANEILGKTKDGKDIKLSDYIEYGIVEDVTVAYGADVRMTARGDIGTASKLNTAYSKEYELVGKTTTATDADVFALVVYMPETVGNEANHNGTNVPVINLGLNVVATQNTVESDFFNDQYDKDATYTAEVDALKTKLSSAQPGDIIEVSLSHDAFVNSAIVVPNGVKMIFNGNGHTIISNSNAPVFQIVNADAEISDVTITGKAKYAIYTKGARWDPEDPNADTVLTNVTVNMAKSGNFPVTFNGMGTVIMKDCTVTGDGLHSDDHADGLHVFAGAEINLTVDGGNIGGIMLNSNYASSATMTAKNGAEIDTVDVECSTATDGSLVAAPITNDGATINDVFYAVYDKVQLKAALDNSYNVVLTGNVSTTDKLTVKNGAYLDGKGYTIDFGGNFNGYVKAIDVLNGSTIKNLHIANAGRAFGADGCNGDIYLDNISGTNAHYFFNGDTPSGSNAYISNSTLDGWISYGNVGLMSFDTCLLKGDTSLFYGMCYYVVFGDTEFENCTFDNFYMAMNKGAVNSGATGSVVTITNCVYVTSEGTVKVTADNFKSLLMGPGDETDFNRMLNNATIIVDGVTVAI